MLDVVYDGLVRYDPKTTEPYNYVAESVETDDNTVWTIKIKPDLTFQNGEPVDADAFARAWNYAAYGPNAMANNYFFERIAGYDEMQGETDDDGNVTKEPEADTLSGLKVVDPQTLEVTLTGPFAGFGTMLGYTGFFPIAQECLDDIEACAVQPIGNGPFQVEKWDQGVNLTAKRWEDYTLEETPGGYGAIEWTEYTGEDNWPDFQAGNLDFAVPPPAEQQVAANDPRPAGAVRRGPGRRADVHGLPAVQGRPVEGRRVSQGDLARGRPAGHHRRPPAGSAGARGSWVVPDVVPGGTGARASGAPSTRTPPRRRWRRRAAGPTARS